MPSLQMAAVRSGGLWRLRHNTARPDILAADEAQPVEPLLGGQTDGFRAFVHASLLRFRQSCQAV